MILSLEADASTLRRELAKRAGPLPPMPTTKQQLLDYQLMALYALAREHNHVGARILEIGTGHGSSGYLLSRAAPKARITSLTVSPAEQTIAERIWRRQDCRNITVRAESSWAFLARNTETWDLVFLDGDHNRIALDLPWFDRLREGGLLLCHDYSPQDARSPSGIVYEELNAMAERLGRPFDVRIVDEGKVGMAGFYRRAGESVAGRAGAVPADTSSEIPDAPPLLSGAGLVLRQDDPAARSRAAAAGLSLAVSSGWGLPWSRTLFVAPDTRIPWDLLEAGFGFLERWDLAVPFAPGTQLAESLGTPEDRERTRAVAEDLRVPVYSPDLLFVRDTADGRACLERWRLECDGGDDRLAFLRALALVKPRCCVLPRLWLAPAAERETITQHSARGRR